MRDGQLADKQAQAIGTGYEAVEWWLQDQHDGSLHPVGGSGLHCSTVRVCASLNDASSRMRIAKQATWHTWPGGGCGTGRRLTEVAGGLVGRIWNQAPLPASGGSGY